MQVRKHTSEGIHPDFETQGGRPQNFKTGYQWPHRKDLRPPNFKKNRIKSTICMRFSVGQVSHFGEMKRHISWGHSFYANAEFTLQVNLIKLDTNFGSSSRTILRFQIHLAYVFPSMAGRGLFLCFFKILIETSSVKLNG